MTNLISSQTRIAGLDSIRMVCALLVVMDHLHPAFPHVGGFGKLVNLCFWGQPAVIVFFVISGFCIHHPNSAVKAPFRVLPFLVRRLVRIGAPLGVLFFGLRSAGMSLLNVDGGVLWSLYCEIAYYLIYPALFRLARKTNWEILLLASLFLSLFEMIRLPHPTAFYHHGFWGMIVLGLPIWIMGCLLAEWLPKSQMPAGLAMIWLWRAGMFFGGTVLNFIHFHGGIGYSWMLWIYGLATILWLRMEIAYATAKGVPKFLEFSGKASYSVYICHLPFYALCAWIGMKQDSFFSVSICIILSVLGAGLFCLIIEFPSLRLASYMARLTARSYSGV